DGQRFVHAPLRLSVFIEAPHSAIEAILAKHSTLRDLVAGGWLHLFALDGAQCQPVRRQAMS
ncbi:MAG: putative inorganic carbon transporter subunit DabA, partial [Polyangiales bacterium]